MCRFFSTHAWDADSVGLALARLIVTRLLDHDAPIEVVVDDTLFRRWGPRVFGSLFWTHRFLPGRPTRSAAATGGLVAGIIVELPFCSHPVCLPILFRLWRGKGTPSPVRLAGQLITLLAKEFPRVYDPPGG